jgi:hypothetical protein
VGIARLSIIEKCCGSNQKESSLNNKPKFQRVAAPEPTCKMKWADRGLLAGRLRQRFSRSENTWASALIAPFEYLKKTIKATKSFLKANHQTSFRPNC